MLFYTSSSSNYEILISNMHRAVREQEIEKIREFFLKRKIDANTIDRAAIRTIYAII